ncbi:hypothetical protein HYQ46_001243 [Verticillium longisporum]|nr:hypothetical protein HYQ46_001243 [Verticillium longisporum]
MCRRKPLSSVLWEAKSTADAIPVDNNHIGGSKVDRAGTCRRCRCTDREGSRHILQRSRRTERPSKEPLLP